MDSFNFLISFFCRSDLPPTTVMRQSPEELSSLHTVHIQYKYMMDYIVITRLHVSTSYDWLVLCHGIE